MNRPECVRTRVSASGIACTVVLLAGLLALSAVAGLPGVTAASAYEKGLRVLEERGLEGTESALALFDRALARDPGLEEAYLAAAQTCLFRFEFSDEKDRAWLTRGSAYVDRLLERNPESAEAYVTRALILLDLESPHRAVLALKRALRIEPAHLAANLTYLAQLVNAGKKNEAVAFARSSGQHFAEDPAVMKQYGKLLLQAGCWEESTPFFNQALDMDEEDDAEILKGLGVAHYQMGNYLYAASMFGKAHEWDPDDLSSLAQISLCFAKAGKYLDASIYTERYLAVKPDDLSARRQLAAYYDKLGRPEDAARIRREIGRDEAR